MQDRKLAALKLFRFKIPEDGNCLFRAVSSQLYLNQEAHSKLRNDAANWMRTHADELEASGLVDNDRKEIDETASEGGWGGQAALVALSNLLGISIFVHLGGDKGKFEMQEISPHFALDDSSAIEIVRLAYLSCGHYDAVVTEQPQSNTVYDTWLLEREHMLMTDAALATILSGNVQVEKAVVSEVIFKNLLNIVKPVPVDKVKPAISSAASGSTNNKG